MDKKTLLIKANTMILPRFGGEGYISGVGRSTKSLVYALMKEKKSFDIALYATGINSYWLKNIDTACKKYRFLLPQKIGTQLTEIEPCYVHHHMKHDLIHIPHNYDVVSKKDKMVVTIHDTCLYDIAKQNKNAHMTSLWETTAKQAVGIITCSENTKIDIIDRFGVKENKIKVVPWGISHDIFHKEAQNITKERTNNLGIKSPFFLAVSCANKRKNINNLLKGFEIFAQSNKDIILVLLWSNPPIELLKRFQHFIANRRIIFLNYVTDQELNALYNEALATLFPSRYEGFGFPILESFACGTPVMTCKNSSLKEIGKDLAIYTNEDDVEQMASIMQELSTGSYKTKELSEVYSAYAKTYTWEETAKAYISFYEDFL